MSFSCLLDEIEAWRGTYQAQHPEPAVPSKREPEVIMAKSIRLVPATGETLALINRVRGHVEKPKPKVAVLVKSREVVERQARDAEAGRLLRITKTFDKAVAEGKLSAIETARVENLLHAAAARIGAV